MARYIQDIILNKPDDFVQFTMNDFLQKNNYKLGQWKGESTYTAGNALVSGARFLKWSYTDGKFHLEAWVQGNLGAEWDLDGMVGMALKKPYKKKLEQLLQVLQQDIPAGNAQAQTAQAGVAAGDTASQESSNPAPKPIPVKTADNTGAATASLVLGILSIVIGVFLPLIGVILGTIGITRANTGAGSSGVEKGGRITSIIGICISIAGWLLNFLLGIALF